MSRKIPLSIAIITKNEELNITEALESIRDFNDIVVVDSFSTDRTLEICRNYTDRIYQHEWMGFSTQKQKAVDYAKNDWVMILDADERVTPELKHEMMREIAIGGNVGFYVPRKNFFLGKWIRRSGWWPDYTLRIFRKDAGYVEPREVHEKVVINGPTAYLKNPLIHHTYTTLNDYMQKMDLYSGLAAEGILRQNGRPSSCSLIINPAAVFLKMYILRQGFRDGIHGLMLAILYAFQTFLKYAKALEKDL
ncbi:MAG: glycosyltransferase family 2 protein [Dissulfurispiraceae bacterium]